jgi:hypothetical protein
MVKNDLTMNEAAARQEEGETALAEFLGCDIDWFTDKYSIFDSALYADGCYEDGYGTPFAYAEVKGRYFRHDAYPDSLLDQGKLEAARSVWQTEQSPCYLVIVWNDVIGITELTKLTDEQLLFKWLWANDTGQNRRRNALRVFIPIPLFIVRPRGYGS